MLYLPVLIYGIGGEITTGYKSTCFKLINQCTNIIKIMNVSFLGIYSVDLLFMNELQYLLNLHTLLIAMLGKPHTSFKSMHKI